MLHSIGWTFDFENINFQFSHYSQASQIEYYCKIRGVGNQFIGFWFVHKSKTDDLEIEKSKKKTK